MTTTGKDQRYHFHIFSSSELCRHQTVLNQTVQYTLLGHSLTLTSTSSVKSYHIKHVCVYHSVLNSLQVHVRMPVCRTPLRVVRGCVRPYTRQPDLLSDYIQQNTSLKSYPQQLPSVLILSQIYLLQ